jgi:hypothetical protein
MDHFGPREATTQDLTRGPKAPALRIHVHSNADGGSRNIEQQGREQCQEQDALVHARRRESHWRAGDPEVAVT